MTVQTGGGYLIWGFGLLFVGALLSFTGAYFVHTGDGLNQKASEQEIIRQTKETEQALRKQLEIQSTKLEEAKKEIIDVFTKAISYLQQSKKEELGIKFPVGYQLFGLIDGKVIPYEVPSSEQIKIDWSTAKILKVTNDTIEIVLPDAIISGGIVLSHNTVIVKNQEGYYAENLMNIRGWKPFVGILKSDKNRIIAVLGYKFLSK